MAEKTLKKARGLNSIADPSKFRGSNGRRSAPVPEEVLPEVVEKNEVEIDLRVEQKIEDIPKPVVTPHRAVQPGTKRVRRELSIPILIADKLEETGINPADIVMQAYRKYSDNIFEGQKGRMVSKGRKRLRISISDKEFEQITRLGQARGWNRSETVSVLLAAELVELD